MIVPHTTFFGRTFRARTHRTLRLALVHHRAVTDRELSTIRLRIPTIDIVGRFPVLLHPTITAASFWQTLSRAKVSVAIRVAVRTGELRIRHKHLSHSLVIVLRLPVVGASRQILGKLRCPSNHHRCPQLRLVNLILICGRRRRSFRIDHDFVEELLDAVRQIEVEADAGARTDARQLREAFRRRQRSQTEPIVVNQIDDFAIEWVGSGFAERQRGGLVFGRRWIADAIVAKSDSLE